MYKTIASITALAALAATVTAHGTVTGVTIDGQYKQGFLLQYYYQMQQNQKVPEHLGWYAEDLDNGFVAPSSYTKPDIICHKAASPKGSSDTMGKVAAGGTIEFHWTDWPTSHGGPVITYVAPYTGDILSVKKEDLRWTKIDAHGYENGEWAAVKMIGQNNTWPVTVPKDLAAGKYVFRHEIIALHSAGQEDGAQNYPQCLNIEVTGSGTQKPAGVAGTALYTPTDPGIKVNIYQGKLDSYVIPGPALFGSSGSTTPSPASSASPSSAAPTAAPAASPAASPAPSTGGKLPETFTLETFITWLEGKAGGSSKKARPHPRSFL